MAEALIIESRVDATGVATGINQVEKAFGEGVRKIRDTAAQGTGGVSGLEKQFNKLTQIRAPNILADVNRELLQQIPLLRESNIAFSLANTAAFSFSTILTKLAGPAGLVLGLVGALALVINEFRKKKQAVDEASKALETNQQRLGEFNSFADQYVNSLKELAKSEDAYGKAAKEAIRGTIGDVEKKISAEKTDIITINEKLRTEKAVLEAMIPTSTGYKEQTETVNNLQKALAIHVVQLAELQTKYKGLKTAIAEAKVEMGAIPELVFQGQFEWMNRPGISKPEDSPIAKALKAAEERMGMVNRAIKETGDSLKKDINVELQIMRNRLIEAEQQAQQNKATFASFAEPLKSAFANAMIGIEQNWGDLIKRMYAELVTSALFKVLGSLFGGPVGGFLSFIGFQQGTSHVPRTGLYLLHGGEAVVSAEKSAFASSYVTQYYGGQTQVIQITQTIDERFVRNKLIPMLRREQQLRRPI